ncbi:hypothetical protein HK098_007873 [Nowakowskiella sp. JEL0407]|nr:hypothetical protein HK098_007873 [Nowakowskiella sp. JEL0407]
MGTSTLGSLGISIYLTGVSAGIAFLQVLFFFTSIKWKRNNVLKNALMTGLLCQFIANLATGYSYAINLEDCEHHRVAGLTYTVADICYSIFVIVKTWQLISPYQGTNRTIAQAMLSIFAIALLTGRMMQFVGGTILYSTAVVPLMYDLSICAPILHESNFFGAILSGVSDVGINLLLLHALHSISNQIVENSDFHQHVSGLRRKGVIALIAVCLVASVHPIVLAITPGEYIVIPILFDQLVAYSAALYSIKKDEDLERNKKTSTSSTYEKRNGTKSRVSRPRNSSQVPTDIGEETV